MMHFGETFNHRFAVYFASSRFVLSHPFFAANASIKLASASAPSTGIAL